MNQKLVIVESPSKSKTIEQYLGKDFTVLSSKGHIRDLAISGKGGLGLDIENDFEPSYATIKQKKKVIKELKNALKDADELYLATDPDREGEAISWHLKEVLNTEDIPTKRVIFNEITREAVLKAFEKPRDIDYDLVSSQETRRILDRIIGFKLSKLLQNKIKSKSAGRVQSAALKLIVDKEKEIDAFEPEEYWKVKALFDKFEADLYKYKNESIDLSSEKETNALLDSLTDSFEITNIEEKTRKKSPKLPFTTSTLQQEAANKLYFSSQKTMLVAQHLYEGIQLKDETVGLITYMRTDSTRLSNTFAYPAIRHIEDFYGSEYKGFVRKAKKGLNVQDAHEAVRPTNVEIHPKEIKSYLSKDEYKLYKLIYARTVASLMKPAKIKKTDVEFTSNEAIFRASAQELVFDGYLKVYGDYERINITTLPPLETGAKMTPNEIDTEQKFTTPPPRYTEARLIKDMEELGIGRPSTYSQTVSTLKHRKYIKTKKKKFHPTDQGKLTIEKLTKFFDQIINVNYTARMEKILDEISVGKEEQTKIISDFYHSFIPMVDNANENMEKIPPKLTGEKCPKCGHDMVIRQSRYGKFEACSNFPKCKYIKDNDDKKKKEPESTGVTCPKCNEGTIVKRVAKRGRNKGKTFYACDNFPKCKNMLFGKPTGEKCPECGQLLIEQEDGSIICQNSKECGYTQ
ncbi:MAG: type I DNA topoisomerase [Candidatus Izimaplasma sp.]|nr:type I DNA topoisomerase [Candidatus Izimaplasma bacterium]